MPTQVKSRSSRVGCSAAERHIDGRVVEYVCARYAKAARRADVVGVRRDRFRAERSLAAYQQLRSAAQAAECWEAERVAALAALRKDARRECGGWYGGPVLIDALLGDGDVDAAWREAAASPTTSSGNSSPTCRARRTRRGRSRSTCGWSSS